MKTYVLALFALTLALGGCSASASTQRDPDTIVALTRDDGATMNPMFATTVQDAQIYGQLLYESLSYIGTDYLPHPRLATSWTHSPDGLHWTLDLRHDVRWSDGVPFTSKDVVYDYRLFLNPDTGFLDFGNVKYIKSVTADGPYRVRFDLDYPSATFTLYALGESLVPEHILSKLPPDRQRFSSLGEHPVGTGPYMLQMWQHDSEAVFVRNPYAWRRPKIGRIDMRIIFNDQSELEALANGSADLIDDLSFTQYKQLQRIAPHIHTLTFPSLYIDLVEFNLRHAGLSDPVVRQAMTYGFDRKSIVDGFFDDKVNIPNSIIPAAVKYWYDPHTLTYPYDPVKARAILDAAGWKLQPDGVRRKGNTRLSFEVLLNQGSSVITDQMLVWIADMKDIGIDIQLRLTDFATLSARTFTGKYDIIADSRGGVVDPDLTTLFASSQMPPNGFNTTYYSDPIVDRDLKLGLSTVDPAKRRVYYDQMQVELAKTQPMMPQYGRFAAMAYGTRMYFDPATTLQSPLMYYNVEDWTMAK